MVNVWCVVQKINKMSLSDSNDIFTTQTTLLTSSMLLSSVIETSSSSSSPSLLLANVTDNNDEIYSNDSFSSNDTFSMTTREYIFDRKEVRYVFITLYSLVFCFCFFGEYKKEFKGDLNQIFYDAGFKRKLID